MQEVLKAGLADLRDCSFENQRYRASGLKGFALGTRQKVGEMQSAVASD
jgi:hypothetical protein